MLTNTQNKSVGAPRQSKPMPETTSLTLDANLDFLNLQEVAKILRVAPISIHRMIARQAIPVYRMCRKLLFKKQDILDCLEKSKNGNSNTYGSPKE